MDLRWENGDPITPETLAQRDQLATHMAIALVEVIQASAGPGDAIPLWALVKVVTYLLGHTAIVREVEAATVVEEFLAVCATYLPAAVPVMEKVLRGGGEPRPGREE